MANIVPRQSETSIARMGKASRLPSKVTRQIEQAAYNGLITAALVQSAAYVTDMSMHYVATLSASEATMIEMSPLAESRLKVLVDRFTLVAASEIERMGW
ncbi:MAG: hypothetical protein M1565_04380 [Actinobacteria bacterium]|nr:hypothetical protein [Actinomycetota bacterium]MCL5735216.1 hypothetical protein [Actinomycetota bacterium]